MNRLFSKIWYYASEFVKGLFLYRFWECKTDCMYCKCKITESFFCKECDVEFYNGVRRANNK